MVSIVSGTNRPNSRTYQISQLYARHLEQAYGVQTEVLNLAEPATDLLAHYRDLGLRMATAQRVVWVFPEYNNSFPGVLKAFLDTFPFPNPLKGAVAGMVGISAGTNGGANAMSHWADIISYLGMIVVPQRVRIYGVNQHWQEGTFTHPVFEELIAQQASQLMAIGPLRS